MKLKADPIVAPITHNNIEYSKCAIAGVVEARDAQSKQLLWSEQVLPKAENIFTPAQRITNMLLVNDTTIHVFDFGNKEYVVKIGIARE